MSELTPWFLDDVPSHHWVQIGYRFPGNWDSPLAGIEYKIISLQDPALAFGGKLDERGRAHHEGLVPGPVEVLLSPEDSVTSRMAADKTQEALKQSIDSLAVLLTSRVAFTEQLLQQNAAPSHLFGCFPYSLPLTNTQSLSAIQAAPEVSKVTWQQWCQWSVEITPQLVSTHLPTHSHFPIAIAEQSLLGDVNGVLQTLQLGLQPERIHGQVQMETHGQVQGKKHGQRQDNPSDTVLSSASIAAAHFLLSDNDVSVIFNAFVETVWKASATHLYARAFVLDLVNALFIELIVEEGTPQADSNSSAFSHCKKVYPALSLLLDEIVQQCRELIDLYRQCKVSATFQGRSNTVIDVEWREPPNPQRSSLHYSNSAEIPKNYDGSLVSSDLEYYFDNSIDSCIDNIVDNDIDNYIDGSCVHGVTGEVVISQQDALINGPIPLVWNRVYRSSNPKGWSTLADEKLCVSKGLVNYYRADGLVVTFELPPIGKYSINMVTGLLLERVFYSIFVIKNSADAERVFRGEYSVVMPSQSGVHSLTQGMDINESIPLAQIKNLHDQHWDFIYDVGVLVGVRSNWGSELLIKRDGSANIISLVSVEGAIVPAQYQWDNNQLVSTELADGILWQYTYSEHQQPLLSTISQPLSPTIIFNWQWNINRWQCVGKASIKNGSTKENVEGAQWSFQYDPLKRETLAQLRLASSENTTPVSELRWFYDKQGLVLSKENEKGERQDFCYNSNAFLVSAKDSEGNAAQYRYDTQGHLTSMMDAGGGGFSLGYDDSGRVQDYSNALGESWSCEYDKKGAIVSVVDPSGLVYRMNCISGFPVSVYVGGGNDGDSDGFRRYWERDSRGNIIVDGANGMLNQATYDCYGNLKQLLDRGTVVLEFAYETSDRLKAVSVNGHSSLVFGYHPSGMLNRLANSAGQQVDLQFDENSRLVCWQENGRGLAIEYDELDRIVELSITGDSEACMQFHYGKGMLPELVVDNQGHQRSLRFDGRGLLTHCTGLEVDAEKMWQYDACGRQIYFCDFSKDVTTGEIKALEVKTLEVKTLEVKTQYDALGRVLEHLDGEAIIQCAYQPGGQLTHYSSALGGCEHEYDEFGFKIKTTYSQGYVVEFSYGLAGVLADVSINGNSVLAVFRDSAGIETHRKQGAISVNSEDGSASRYTNRLFKEKIKNACSQLNSVYQHNLLGQLGLALQLGCVVFPSMLEGEVLRGGFETNSKSGISLIPQECQFDGGVVIFHPVHDEPLIMIRQNQIYFYKAGSYPVWTDWQGSVEKELSESFSKNFDFIDSSLLTGNRYLNMHSVLALGMKG